MKLLYGSVTKQLHCTLSNAIGTESISAANNSYASRFRASGERMSKFLILRMLIGRLA
jgi:hypothetical protein